MTTSDIQQRSAGLERVHYFPNQLMTAVDMLDEQEYFREKLRRHNRYLHGWGVVCGCEVKASPTPERPWQVQVCPGYVITPQGDEIEIASSVYFDLASSRRQPTNPCQQGTPCHPLDEAPAGSDQKTIFLAVCYAECRTRPVRIQPAGCGCDDTACEYSRMRESFEIICLWGLPAAHKAAKEADGQWRSAFARWIKNPGGESLPAPDCPLSPGDPCVVLCSINLPENSSTQIVDRKIHPEVRRIIRSAQIGLMG